MQASLCTGAESFVGRITGSIHTVVKEQNRAHHIHLISWLLPGHVQCSLWPKGSKLGLAVPREESTSPDPFPAFILQAGMSLGQLWCRDGCASQNPATPPLETQWASLEMLLFSGANRWHPMHHLILSCLFLSVAALSWYVGSLPLHNYLSLGF